MKTFTQIYIMLVFGVKYRTGLIHTQMQAPLYAAISKIIESHGAGSRLICIGGYKDHTHILVSLSANISIADLVREIKSRSSRWINEEHLAPCHFEWQRGYGAFSYASTSKANVINYIEHQDEHHKKLSFREEFENFLSAYELVSDPRDLPQDLI